MAMKTKEVSLKVKELVLQSMENHRAYVKKNPSYVMRKHGEDNKGISIFKVDSEATDIRRREELQSIEDRINLYRETGKFKADLD